MTGRPSSFTQEIADEICKRLSNGEPLTVICREDGKPCDDTVREWAKTRPALSRAIACARVVGHDMIAWRARQTLRGKGPDEGGESTGDVQRDKAIADFDLKLLSKWDPKRWGEKMTLAGDDENPLRFERIERRIVDPKGTENPGLSQPSEMNSSNMVD